MPFAGSGDEPAIDRLARCAGVLVDPSGDNIDILGLLVG